jgi:hypothetical protein
MLIAPKSPSSSFLLNWFVFRKTKIMLISRFVGFRNYRFSILVKFERKVGNSGRIFDRPDDPVGHVEVGAHVAQAPVRKGFYN